MTPGSPTGTTGTNGWIDSRSEAGTACPHASIPAALEHWARKTPHAHALTAGDTVLDYAALHRTVLAAADGLRTLGVRREERVVIAGHNTVDWVVAYLAVLTLGAVAAPANNRLNADQFAAQVALLEASAVLVDDDHTSLTAGLDPLLVHPLEKLGAAAHAAREQAPQGAGHEPGGRGEPVAPSAAALISFTSGTTGVPKGAVLSSAALVRASWTFATVLGTTAADSTLVMVPLFHNTGFVDQLGHMLLVGGRTDLLHHFRTGLAVQALTDRPTTYLTAVPSIVRLLMLADGADDALRPVRVLLYGGSAMPSAWSAELLRRWPALRLFHGYGLTEYGSAVSFLPPEHAADRGESVGFTVPGTHVRIVDETERDVPAGATGELWVQDPTMMSGYWRQPRLTADKIRDGWLRTGDLARWDGPFLYLEGRVDDVINRGGEKILPSHVESLLAQQPAVAQSSVFGVPDPILQHRVWAAVEERPGAVFDESAARTALAVALPDYAIPEHIHVLDKLPRTASGKVDRRAVAARITSETLADTVPEAGSGTASTKPMPASGAATQEEDRS